MAIAPSPTAVATRLAEPLRTSPTAKMPGRLVSSAELRVSWPVRTKPSGVQVDQAASQPLQGVMPMNTNSARASRTRRSPVRLSRDRDRLQRLVAEQFPHLGAEQDAHVRDPADLIDQVPRHVLAQIGLADDQRDLRGVPGQEDRRLPGRVAAADDGHRIAAAHQRLRLRGRVVDAHLLEVVRPGHVQPPVPRPGRDDHRGGRDRAPIGQPDWYRLPSRSMAVASAGTANRAPNFRAWIIARSASSAPEIPDGKPR